MTTLVHIGEWIVGIVLYSAVIGYIGYRWGMSIANRAVAEGKSLANSAVSAIDKRIG